MGPTNRSRSVCSKAWGAGQRVVEQLGAPRFRLHALHNSADDGTRLDKTFGFET